jgi:uncharacterized protein (TIGR02466 family)
METTTTVPNMHAEVPQASGAILRAFATPIARIPYPHAAAFNEQLSDIVLARLYNVENKHTYKTETSADMTQWGEPVIDSLSSWVTQMARRFAEAITERTLEEAYLDGIARSGEMYNGQDGSRAPEAVSIFIERSWASIYAKRSHHPAHFHPNTPLAAIYYVQAPGTCDLDLLDPRVNIDYFDPGIQLANEGHALRLQCKPGELLIFPGWLKHAVPEFGGDSLRISMSWNLSYSYGSCSSLVRHEAYCYIGPQSGQR